MADTKITLTIPEVKLDRVLEGITGLYPIPQILNEETQKMENEFTDKVWAKEVIVKYIKNTVMRSEIKLAKESLILESTDDIIS